MSWGLEQFDEVARRVLPEDLSSAEAADDVVAEADTGRREPFDFGGDVVDDEMDTVPAAGLRGRAVGHGPGGGAFRPRRQQPQRAAGDIGGRGAVVVGDIVSVLGALLITKMPILWGEAALLTGKSRSWDFIHESRTDLAQLRGSVFLFIVGAGAWSLDARLAQGATTTPLPADRKTSR
ncbi:hypothetical protein ACWCPQ_07755 [Nocardia sp. NPDC001965]